MNSCQLHDALKIFLISTHFPFHIFTLHFIFCLSHACCCLNEEKIKLNYYWGVVSVLGPYPYFLFTADVLQIISEAGVGIQQYADDTQAYQHCKPNDAMRAFTQLQNTFTIVPRLHVLKSFEAEP